MLRRQLGLPLRANALQLLLQRGVLHLQRRPRLLQLTRQRLRLLPRCRRLGLRCLALLAQLRLHAAQLLAAVRPLVLQSVAQRLGCGAQLACRCRSRPPLLTQLLLQPGAPVLRCLQLLGQAGAVRLQRLYHDTQGGRRGGLGSRNTGPVPTP